MNLDLSDWVRVVAEAKYVRPALAAGRRTFSIPVRDLLEELRQAGFPPNHTPQVCNAIQTGKFLRAHGLAIEGVDGPPSKTSTTVVVRYRTESERADPKSAVPSDSTGPAKEEDPQARAKRLTDKLRGLLKEELAEYGGGEAFLRWIRSEDEDAA